MSFLLAWWRSSAPVVVTNWWLVPSATTPDTASLVYFLPDGRRRTLFVTPTPSSYFPDKHYPRSRCSSLQGQVRLAKSGLDVYPMPSGNACFKGPPSFHLPFSCFNPSEADLVQGTPLESMAGDDLVRRSVFSLFSFFAHREGNWSIEFCPRWGFSAMGRSSGLGRSILNHHLSSVVLFKNLRQLTDLYHTVLVFDIDGAVHLFTPPRYDWSHLAPEDMDPEHREVTEAVMGLWRQV